MRRRNKYPGIPLIEREHPYLRQVFGLRGAISKKSPNGWSFPFVKEQCLAFRPPAFVPHYRCATVPDFHRIPCLQPLYIGLDLKYAHNILWAVKYVKIFWLFQSLAEISSSCDQVSRRKIFERIIGLPAALAVNKV
jgi:hypothetical protein